MLLTWIPSCWYLKSLMVCLSTVEYTCLTLTTSSNVVELLLLLYLLALSERVTIQKDYLKAIKLEVIIARRLEVIITWSSLFH